MQEIERKILGIDKDALVAKLLKLGAQKKFSGLVRTKYFDHKDGRIKKRNDLLRVREFIEDGKGAYSEIVYKTFKGFEKGCKVVDETELKLPGAESFATICLLLEKLDFEQVKYFEKKREIYVYEKWKFEFDEYPKIPEFLEIEAQSIGDIDEAVKLLGLEEYEQTADAISRLLKRKYPKVELDGLVF
ncbi:hypothetical protein COV82_03315 [Candidatus Peregrinibacteria bacterium CG11_big_fil_rev_8_21_14_0_20_46_8]|nr:MAG: hypothetical protein COV82_03315 [Candidatus Peregrinibacteria bacterium CG11_big_fil_rev_8_21_14_0_20_46_8]